ncbi:hypothetical protein A2U01_0017554 [Trifolium medium]|uniref:Uncharacterized protein n=1 Tax=Trifolium medium TaxID=97028 RepID=A0A392N9Q4_9FABA|nr:hypothetical protein [Trifolium medium]
MTLTIARNPKHQNLHEEAAAAGGSNGLISYQSPTTNPQKLVALNYDGPTNEPSKYICVKSYQGHPIVVPIVRVPNIPHVYHGRPCRPPP